MKNEPPKEPNDDGNVIIIGGPPSNLPAIISSLFIPAGTAEYADDLISGADLFDSIQQHCDASKEDIFNEMQAQGFITKSIEGQLYWLIINP